MRPNIPHVRFSAPSLGAERSRRTGAELAPPGRALPPGLGTPSPCVERPGALGFQNSRTSLLSIPQGLKLSPAGRGPLLSHRLLPPALVPPKPQLTVVVIDEPGRRSRGVGGHPSCAPTLR